ncbi:MAG TPA: GNAT family N-acetyltransferase [Candidatus Polarisedimenticolia bacterium]|nr:GNAT family N-acetyltransferase [Candidatus Polarisedimenticolia bacterium]
MNIQDIRRNIRNAGVAGAVFDLGYRIANRSGRLMVLQMMKVTMESLDPEFLARGAPWERFQGSFLDEAAVRRHGIDPANEMAPRFLEEALAKRDRCYALMDGDRLAAYGWYSTRETALGDGLTLSYGPQWVYMYKGFTHPAYRGLRLHARGMAGALQATASEGYRGLLSFVEANNFSSLRSVHRMGYRDIGRIVVLGILGRHWISVAPECRPYGLELRCRRAECGDFPSS